MIPQNGQDLTILLFKRNYFLYKLGIMEEIFEVRITDSKPKVTTHLLFGILGESFFWDSICTL